MKKTKLAFFSVLVSLLPRLACAADLPSRNLLQKALEAQGGEQRLRALESVQFEAAGYRNLLEQSERPEGPYVTDFLAATEIHDYRHNRFRSASESKVYPLFHSSSVTVVSDGFAMRSTDGHAAAGSAQSIQLAQERMALSPEHVLLTALDAPDRHVESNVLLQSISQNVVAFSLDGAPVRVYLNPYTHLPTAVDYSGPLARGGYWRYLGDVTMRTYYSFWWLAKGGVHLPMQWNVESNGLPDQMLIIQKLRIDAPINEADVAIPDAIRVQFQKAPTPVDLDHIPLGRSDDSPKEVAPGIIFIPGYWNVTLVDQKDGIVVIEAPISSGYSAKVIAEAHRRFPGEPIKAVITTSDSWPHIGGLREYVAEDVPIYALDLNKPILDRLFTIPHTSNPDTLQRAPRKARLQLVRDKTSIGTGPNRIEIYPIRGETSERQMMVYFPERQLLYGSDPFQRLENGSFSFPQTVSELMDAVAHEHLDVRTFFMMHIDPTVWEDLPKAVAAAEEQDSPSGIP